MELDPRLHFVVVTGIVVKREMDAAGQPAAPRFLIAKRAPTEKAFPNKWTVPGGKFVRTEYEGLPKRPYVAGQKPASDGGAPQWYNLVEWVLRREVREEVNVEIAAPQYLTDLVFIRPDGYPVVTLSFWAMYQSGDAKPGKDLTEVAWVTAEEAKTYYLIEGIAEEIAEVAHLLPLTNNQLLITNDQFSRQSQHDPSESGAGDGRADPAHCARTAARRLL